ncbi:MAG: SDR family oxidoreductase [Alphaproteobacteria bacterium]|nr:SDR family oxidoreductase [Alphaproteobacteria bacterium]
MTHSVALDGKVAIVTGAASGIGEAIAKAYLSAGAKVVAADLTAPRIDGSPDALLSLVCDVTDDDAPARLCGAAANAFGGLDILVNNAGVCLPGSIEDQSLEDWEKTFAINVTAPFRTSQAAIPMLKERGGGRIINLGSIMSEFGGPGLCAYGTSKHAVAGLSKGMAADLGKYGITVNYLQPGSIWSGMSRPFMADADFRKYWESKAPMGRIGDPEDVAAAALFLATDGSRFVSGAGIRVCGGAMSTF